MVHQNMLQKLLRRYTLDISNFRKIRCLLLKNIFYCYGEFVLFLQFYDPFFKNFSLSSQRFCNKPTHRRHFNLRKFHNSINGDTSSNRVTYRRWQANGQLLCRTIVWPANNGWWILLRMGDMEALILLSRRVYAASKCKAHMRSLIAGCVYARTHALSPYHGVYIGKSLLAMRLSSVLQSDIHHFYYSGIPSGWIIVDPRKNLCLRSASHGISPFFTKNILTNDTRKEWFC